MQPHATSGRKGSDVTLCRLDDFSFSKDINDVVDGIIRNDRTYLSCRDADPEYIQEVKDALAHCNEMADLFASRQ